MFPISPPPFPKPKDNGLLPSFGSKEGTIVGECLCHCSAQGVKVVLPDSVAPPIGEFLAAEPKSQCRDDNAQRGADVEST